jgi:hypothetical protein
MPYRLGDDLDDFCSRCRMLTNNSVEAMLGEEVVKVRCRTCNFSHDYKHGQVPENIKPRKTSKKAAFDAVLSSVMSGKGLAEKVEAGTDNTTRKPRKAATHHGLPTLSDRRQLVTSSTPGLEPKP